MRKNLRNKLCNAVGLGAEKLVDLQEDMKTACITDFPDDDTGTRDF
jgi:hypothetical protein